MCSQEYDPGLAMIKVTQPRPVDSSTDRHMIEVSTILELFMAEAVKIEGMPLKPTHSIHGHQYHKSGPWGMYLTVGKATEFVDEVGFFTLEVVDAKGLAQQITLDLTLHKFGELQDGKVSNSAIELESLHVLVVLPAGLLATSIDKNMIKVAWQRHDFEVLKMNREGVKIGGKRLKGMGTELNRYHFNIRPRDSDLAHAAYPHMLDALAAPAVTTLFAPIDALPVVLMELGNGCQGDATSSPQLSGPARTG